MTENNAELSRRGFFKSAGLLFANLLAPLEPKMPPKDSVTPERLAALQESQRLASLMAHMSRSRGKGNPLGSKIMEWKLEGDEVAQRYYNSLGLDYYAIENKPVYVVLTNQFGAKKNKHQTFTIIAYDRDAMYNWKAPNPIYQYGILQTSGGGEYGPEIHEQVEVKHEDIRRLKFVEPGKPDFDTYFKSLIHELGYDQETW